MPSPCRHTLPTPRVSARGGCWRGAARGPGRDVSLREGSTTAKPESECLASPFSTGFTYDFEPEGTVWCLPRPPAKVKGAAACSGRRLAKAGRCFTNSVLLQIAKPYALGVPRCCEAEQLTTPSYFCRQPHAALPGVLAARGSACGQRPPGQGLQGRG